MNGALAQVMEKAIAEQNTEKPNLFIASWAALCPEIQEVSLTLEFSGRIAFLTNMMVIEVACV